MSRDSEERVDRDQAIEEMLPLVRYVASRIATRMPATVDIDDLVQHGVLGLLDAFAKFDRDKGTKFRTYAELRIRGAIMDGLRTADWVPRSVRQQRRAVDAARRKAEREYGRAAEDVEVASNMGLALSEFQTLESRVQGLGLHSLEEFLSDGEDVGLLRRSAQLAVEAKNPQAEAERRELRDRLAACLDQLPERQRTVLSLYYYEELNLKEIGRVLGISESRVSQIHGMALKGVRAKLAAAGTSRSIAA